MIQKPKRVVFSPSTTESAGQISLSFSARASSGWVPMEKNMGVCFKIVPPKPIWLVVSTYPSEKWWTESQLGLWHSQYDGKVNPNSMVPVITNQQWFNGQSSCSYEMAGTISDVPHFQKKTPVKWWEIVTINGGPKSWENPSNCCGWLSSQMTDCRRLSCSSLGDKNMIIYNQLWLS